MTSLKARVSEIVVRYLVPGGISAEQAMRELIALSDPWPQEQPAAPFGYLCDWGPDNTGLPRQIFYYGEPGSAAEDDWNEVPQVHRNLPLYVRGDA